MVERILKALDSLRLSQISQAIEDSAIRKKEKMMLCVGLADFLGTLRPSPQQMTQITGRILEGLIHLCDDKDADIRTVADESLNRIIRLLVDVNPMRLQQELLKIIQKNGPPRCVRTALMKFSLLCQHPLSISPHRGRQFAMAFVPCLITILQRNEESVHETLQNAVENIFKILGVFMQDQEIKKLLKVCFSNLSSDNAVLRRAAAFNILVLIKYSKNSPYLIQYAVNSLFDLVLPISETTSIHTILGFLHSIRLLLPHILDGSDENLSCKSLQIYELILHCTNHKDHNVITASLEALNQLLKNPSWELKNILLNPKGIRKSFIFGQSVGLAKDRSFSEMGSLTSLQNDPSDFELSNEFLNASLENLTVRKSHFIGCISEDIEDSESESSLAEDSVSSPFFMKSFNFPQNSVKEDSDEEELISIATSYYDQEKLLNTGSFTDPNMPIIYLSRHLASFLLTGTPNGLQSDRKTRVSVKSLVLSCLSHIVKIYPEAIALTVNEDSEQHLVDILQFSEHSDPLIKGNLCFLIGNFINFGLSGEFDFLAVEFALDSLFKIILSDPATERLGLLGLHSCLRNVIKSDYCYKLCEFLYKLISCKNQDTYWLNKVRLLDVLSDINFIFISNTKTFQKDTLDFIFNCLKDKDSRVRTASVSALVKLVPKLFFGTDRTIQFSQLFFQNLKKSFSIQLNKSNENLLFPPFLDCKPSENKIVEENLFRIIARLNILLLEADNFIKFSGYIEALKTLSLEFPPVNYPRPWCCISTKENAPSTGLLQFLLSISSQYTYFLDLTCLENGIYLIGNLYAGFSLYGLEIKSDNLSPQDFWNNFISSEISEISRKFLKFLLKILNIYAQLYEERFLKSSNSGLLPFGLIFKKDEKIEERAKKSTRQSFYIKLLNNLRSAHTVYKISLDPSASEKFMSLLKSVIYSLSILLEMGLPADTITISEEILSYLRATMMWLPSSTLTCIIQLLKSIFGANLAFHSEGFPFETDFGVESFYGNVFQLPEQLIRDRIRGREKTGIKEKSDAQKKFQGLDKSVLEARIRLFEPVVIKALQLYLSTNDVEIQTLVLSLIIQLVQLKVNYFSLDSNLAVMNYVIKQFELIENGQILNVEKLLPKMFQFLILLSNEKQRKNLVTLPKVLQLFDNLLASEQPKQTHCVPGLQPIVEEIFLNKKLQSQLLSDEKKEWEAQKEVLFNMLIRLCKYPKILYLLSHSGIITDVVSETVLKLLRDDQVELGTLEDNQAFSYFMVNIPLTSLQSLLEVFFSEPIKYDCPETVYRWLVSKSIILETLLGFREETILSKVESIKINIDLSSFLIDSKFSPDPFSVSCVFPQYPPDEAFARFLYSSLAKMAEFILKEPNIEKFQNELFLFFLAIFHLIVHGSFRKITQAFQTLVEEELYFVKKISNLYLKMSSVNFMLTCQYLNLMGLLSYTKFEFWDRVLVNKATFPQKVVKKSGLLALTDYLCETPGDVETIKYLILKNSKDILKLSDETPICEFLTVVMRKEDLCNLFLAQIQNLDPKPKLLEKILRFLSVVDNSYCVMVLKCLLKFLKHPCSYLAQHCASLTAERVDYLLNANEDYDFKNDFENVEIPDRFTNLKKLLHDSETPIKFDFDANAIKETVLDENWFFTHLRSRCLGESYPGPIISQVLSDLNYEKLENLFQDEKFNLRILKECFKTKKGTDLYKISEKYLLKHLKFSKTSLTLIEAVTAYILKSPTPTDLSEDDCNNLRKLILNSLEMVLEQKSLLELESFLKLSSAALNCTFTKFDQEFLDKYALLLRKYSFQKFEENIWLERLHGKYELPTFLSNLLRETTVSVCRLPQLLGKLLQPPESFELADSDCLNNFISKFNELGWESKAQFEEIWASLLSVLVLNGNTEDAQQAVIMAIDGISSLLKGTLFYLKRGDPTCKNYFYHSRYFILASEYEKSLPSRIIKQNLFLNLEFLGKTDRYLVGQFSLEYLWAAVKAPGSETFQVNLHSTDLDLDSCTHFLLDIYSQWLIQPQDSRLITAVLENCLILTDLLTEANQFLGLLDFLLSLESTLVPTEPPLVNLFCLLIAKCLAVLLPFYNDNQTTLFLEHLDRLKALINRSDITVCRLSILQSLLYLLEAPVLYWRLNPPSKKLDNSLFYNVGDTAVVSGILSFVQLAIDLVKLFGEERVNWNEDLEAHHWALLFYLLQHYQGDLNELKNYFFNFLLSSVKKKTTDRLYFSIIQGIEKLLLSNSLEYFYVSQIVDTAQLLITNDSSAMRIGGMQLLKTASFLEKRSAADLYETPERISSGMERISFLMEKMKRSYVQEAKLLADVLSYLLKDFSPFDVLTKLIQEFLSPNQPHTKILASLLFQVLEQADLNMVQDWLVFSLSSITERVSVNRAIWNLLCFFLSASRNPWLRKMFPLILDQWGSEEMVYKFLLFEAALDFYQQLPENPDDRRQEVISVFERLSSNSDLFKELLSIIK